MDHLAPIGESGDQCGRAKKVKLHLLQCHPYQFTARKNNLWLVNHDLWDILVHSAIITPPPYLYATCLTGERWCLFMNSPGWAIQRSYEARYAPTQFHIRIPSRIRSHVHQCASQSKAGMLTTRPLELGCFLPQHDLHNTCRWAVMWGMVSWSNESVWHLFKLCECHSE